VPELEQLRTKPSAPTVGAGLLDACLERAGLREDKDLHCEAWVLVTQATDTLQTGLQAKPRSKVDKQ